MGPPPAGDSEEAEMDADTTWKECPAGSGEYRRELALTVRGYVTPATYRNNYHWQAWRGEGCVSGFTDSADEAMRRADEQLARPIEEFNADCLVELLEELRELERKILSIAPTRELLPGVESVRQAVRAAIATGKDEV